MGGGDLLKRAALTKGSPDDEHARDARIASPDALNETARYGSIASASSTMSPCAPRGGSGGDQAECRARWMGARRGPQRRERQGPGSRVIWYGARTAPGNLAVIAALAAATDTSPLLSAAFANAASTPSALARTGASTLVSAPSGGSPELCFTRRAASSFATSSDACQACSSAAAAIVTADCGETTPRFVPTWRQAPRGGSRNLRRMLLRRADAMLLLSVAQFSPPDLVSVLWPNYSTSDAKLALANLLLWKSEIGDVVCPTNPAAHAPGSCRPDTLTPHRMTDCRTGT